MLKICKLQFTGRIISSTNFYLPLQTFRPLSSNTKFTLYDILNVSESSSQKEIKMAYYKEAKKCHPDLNPNDKNASARFQELARAYEILSDESKRRDYDNSPYKYDYAETSQSQSQSQSQSKSNSSQQSESDHASTVFNSVLEDMEIILETYYAYKNDIKEEIVYLADSARVGNWEGVRDVISAHKGLVAGLILPVVLLFRFPPLVVAAFRVISWGGTAVLTALIYSGRFSFVAQILWRRLVAMSVEQGKRLKNKARRPPSQSQ